MKNILIAYVFILFELAVPLGEGSIEFIPGWIGYFFLAKAFKGLGDKSETFSKNVMLTEGMAGIDLAIWIVDIFCPGAIITIQTPMKFLLKLFFYVSTYNVVKGIREIQEYHQVDIGAKKMDTAWKLLVGMRIAFVVARVNVVIWLLVTVLYFVACVYQLLVINKTRKAYSGCAQEVKKKSMKEKISMMETWYYEVVSIDGDYANLKRIDIELDDLKLVARALLPAEIMVGSKLKYELMQYEIM